LSVGVWVPLEEPLDPLVSVDPLGLVMPVEPPPWPPAELPWPDAEPVDAVCLLARATTARFSLVGPVWAEAGTESGPLVTEDSPPATPAKPLPKPISAATATGTAKSAAPASPRATILRRHQASNPLPMRSPWP
jgi:hypothetical protein